jgi:hypothetical protein
MRYDNDIRPARPRWIARLGEVTETAFLVGLPAALLVSIVVAAIVHYA